MQDRDIDGRVAPTQTVETHRVDVVVIGAGPCGQAFGALLGRYGHRVVVVERHPDPYPLPRASLTDHEVMRTLQSLGVAERYLEVSARAAPRYHWLNGRGETLMTLSWSERDISGWPTAAIGFQPHLEDCLGIALADSAVPVWRGWTAVDVMHPEGEAVTVELARSHRGDTSARRRLVADYVVAADGANSFVRAACGIGREELGFDSQWLVVDGRVTGPLPRDHRFGAAQIRFNEELFQICDPTRPIFLGPLGAGYRRFEFALLDGETREHMEDAATAWHLLEPFGVGPANFEIFRQIVYGFEARLAQSWRAGRVFLLGDAAHTMPPYMGQGMNSGVRDAKNLAWKLHLVLTGRAPDALLDTYEQERSPDARHWIEASVAVGKVSCTFDHEAARARDEQYLSGGGPAGAPPPGLVAGLLHRPSAGQATSAGGMLGPQGRVRRGERTMLLDDLLPYGAFCLLAIGTRAPVDAGLLADLGPFGLECVEVAVDPADPLAPEAEVEQTVDVDGTYARYAADTGQRFVVVRPDFYVFGAAADAAGLSGVLADLRDQLHAPVRAAAIR